jgi:CIC family chloride channel protein
MKEIAAKFQKLHGTARMVLSTSLYGLIASLGAVGFQLAINWIYSHCYKGPSTGGFGHFAWISLAAMVGSCLLAGWLLNSFCPEAAGSGIPQVKLAYWKEFGYTAKRIAWIKFLAGVVSIGGGQSLGREGPTVQIGGRARGRKTESPDSNRGGSGGGAGRGLQCAAGVGGVCARGNHWGFEQRIDWNGSGCGSDRSFCGACVHGGAAGVFNAENR